jgi:hypothetical protein
MRPEGVPCTVTYSHEFEAHALAMESDYRRLDEMMAGAEWAVSRTGVRGSVVVILNPGGNALDWLEVRAFVEENGATITDIVRVSF